MAIERHENRIVVTDGLKDYHYFLAQVHAIVERLKYLDLVLDFSNCSAAFPTAMLAICAQLMAYRSSGISISLEPPSDKKLLTLFRNANWGFLLDPHRFDASTFKGHTRVPATQYVDVSQQQLAVNRIANVVLGAIPNLERGDFAAFEWAVNELTDNVLVHAESRVGGLVQVSTFQSTTKEIEFVVADAGVGIPASLRGGRPSIASDVEALEWAIKEGVTRDPSIGQGNGLFGTYEICNKSGGQFLVDSGHARLSYHPERGLHVAKQAIPYAGTLVVARIDFSNQELLEQALSFDGVRYTPVDLVDLKYTSDSSNDVHFRLLDECSSFGSRISGKPVRTKLVNLIRMTSGTVRVDFSGVPLLSSSFADEAFGKLFLSVGPLTFMERVQLQNMRETVRGLVNRAIAQRMQFGASDADT